MNRWVIRRRAMLVPGAWGAAHIQNMWLVKDPSESVAYAFPTWDAAIRWAGYPVERLEQWLARQPESRTGYWGQPEGRDDEGRVI